MTADPAKLAFARQLRSNMTDEERILWNRLRNRQFMNLKFRRQVPVGPYIADFLCEFQKLVIELDGQHHADRDAYDAERTAYLESQGYSVIRIDNAELRNADRITDHLARSLQETTP